MRAVEAIPVEKKEDIFSIYHDTPIEKLLCYHNLHCPFDKYDVAEMLVAMCIDHRKYLHMPDNFAYVIRSAGVNLRQQEFQVSFAIGVGNVKAIALIGHNECAMAALSQVEEKFIEGLNQKVNWPPQKGREQFEKYLPLYEIGDEKRHILFETARLREIYPNMLIAPLFFNVNDNHIYQLKEA